MPVVFLLGFFKVLDGHNWVIPKPSLFQTEQTQFSQPFLVEEVLYSSNQLCGPPLDLVDVFPVLGTPGLDATLQVGSHESGVERQIPLSQPTGHAASDAAQNTACTFQYPCYSTPLAVSASSPAPFSLFSCSVEKALHRQIPEHKWGKQVLPKFWTDQLEAGD